MDGWMDGWVDGWVGGWMDGWMGRGWGGWVCVPIFFGKGGYFLAVVSGRYPKKARERGSFRNCHW